MRTEEVAALALAKVDNDRYVLSNLLFARIKELGLGAEPLVKKNIKKDKLADIAMLEIAEGKITLEKIQDAPAR
ncbi:DNA-directed RNA polymerase subunit omega [Helicobacter himalayensis]|uniref:DNA-directed RNA polymerase subunit omega n=1 Tax=Helicobacter himalayensis TaxID=1591088 RepID=UPI003D6E76CD